MSGSFDVSKQVDSMLTVEQDTVVVGPYGLSAAAHLIDQDLKLGIFGKPLDFWCAYMPENMLLT